MFISTSLASSTPAAEAVAARRPKWDSNPRLPSQLGEKNNALRQLSYSCQYILLIVDALRSIQCGAVVKPGNRALTGGSASQPTTGHDAHMYSVNVMYHSILYLQLHLSTDCCVQVMSCAGPTRLQVRDGPGPM